MISPGSIRPKNIIRIAILKTIEIVTFIRSFLHSGLPFAFFKNSFIHGKKFSHKK